MEISDRITCIMDNKSPLNGISPSLLSAGNIVDGYVVQKIIAENTGEATLIQAEKDDKTFVLKIYHSNKRPKKELIEKIKNIKNDYVLTAITSGEYNSRFYEVLPYYKNRDLSSNIPFTAAELVKKVIPFVNSGLEELHKNGIIHRDIKPSNLFFSDDKNYVIIGDFGISSVLKGDMSVGVTSSSRTLGYSAPETSLGYISKESDYYSFGITLLHLIIGHDPFEGMNEMQILFQTINKSINIPETIDAQFTKLLKGLTCKDRQNRWGYEEVTNWLLGENVELVDENENSEYFYEFDGKKYYDLKSLALGFAKNWEEAKKHLYRGIFQEKIEVFDETIAHQCEGLKKLFDKDEAIFRLIYILNPETPLCYKNEFYMNASTLGEKMSNALPNRLENVEKMLLNGCLSHFLEINQYPIELLRQIENIAEQYRAGNYKYYFLLHYILSPEFGFEINDVVFNKITDFASYFDALDKESRQKLSEYLIRSDQFLMWIASLGFEEQVAEWGKMYDNADW